MPATPAAVHPDHSGLQSTAQQNRDYAGSVGIACAECGHDDPSTMLREGCVCCARVRFHDGRACALAGRVIRGEARRGEGECAYCLMDATISPMLGEVTIPGVGESVPFNVGLQHPMTLTGNWQWFPKTKRWGVVATITGPRGAVYALVPYLVQSTPGALHLLVMGGRSSVATPKWAQGVAFVLIGDRLGRVR